MRSRLGIPLLRQRLQCTPGSYRSFSASASRPMAAAEAQDATTAEGQNPKSPVAKSSVPAGTVLRGLNIFKNKTDPVALEDSEYPPWLWNVLTPRASAIDNSNDQYIDPTLTKKQRKRELKRLAKEAAANATGEIKVPIHQQTIDLPVGDGLVETALKADDARDALRRALRQQRRAKIKEANFLKTMS